MIRIIYVYINYHSYSVQGGFAAPDSQQADSEPRMLEGHLRAWRMVYLSIYLSISTSIYIYLLANKTMKEKQKKLANRTMTNIQTPLKNTRPATLSLSIYIYICIRLSISIYLYLSIFISLSLYIYI